MHYKVVPFLATISAKDNAQAAANQLADMINTEAASGWVYVRMENIEINIYDPGNKGCFGFGKTPASQRTTRFDMVVLQRTEAAAAAAEA